MQLMWTVETEATLTPLTPQSTARPSVVLGGGTTLLLSEESTPADAASALKSLRGFRATGRRVVWCDVTQLNGAPNVDLRRWGRRFVEDGGASIVVVNGAGAHEAAIGAREAGAKLGHVVVCPDWAIGRNVLFDLVNPGDTLLALGLPEDVCRRLSDRLQMRSEDRQACLSTVA